MDELISVTEAGEILGVSRSTVAKLIEDGRLEGFRLLGGDGRGANRRGYQVYVRKAQAEELADGSWRRQKPRAQKPE